MFGARLKLGLNDHFGPFWALKIAPLTTQIRGKPLEFQDADIQSPQNFACILI